MAAPFNIISILQGGRLQYEALLLTASWAAVYPDAETRPRLILAEPQPGVKWEYDPRLKDGDLRARLRELGAEIKPFENAVFGSRYPYGNKIIGLTTAPDKENFLFLDTDTVLLKPLDNLVFSRPTASMRRENTWPSVELYGYGLKEIWQSLYARFGLDFMASLDTSFPDDYWEHYLYFNAGWFLGPDPHEFANYFCHYASEIDRAPGKFLAGQSLNPWLDQVALPLTIQALGGGRPPPGEARLDGELSCHYRALPLLYAREPEETIAVVEALAAEQRNKKFFQAYPPFKAMIYGGKGYKARALFDRDRLPGREGGFRKKLKEKNLWMR